jgi:hypothetical protein
VRDGSLDGPRLFRTLTSPADEPPSPQLPRHRIRSPAQERRPATTTCSLRTLRALSATAPLRHLCRRAGHIPTSPGSCAHTATPRGRGEESTLRDDAATDACCPHPHEYWCSLRPRSSRQRRRAHDSPACAALRGRVGPSSSAAQLRTARLLHKLTLRVDPSWPMLWYVATACCRGRCAVPSLSSRCDVLPPPHSSPTTCRSKLSIPQLWVEVEELSGGREWWVCRGALPSFVLGRTDVRMCNLAYDMPGVVPSMCI